MWPFFHKMSKVLLNKRKRSGEGNRNRSVNQEWTIHRHRQHLAEQHRMTANTPPPPKINKENTQDRNLKRWILLTH